MQNYGSVHEYNKIFLVITAELLLKKKLYAVNITKEYMKDLQPSLKLSGVQRTSNVKMTT